MLWWGGCSISFEAWTYFRKVLKEIYSVRPIKNVLILSVLFYIKIVVWIRIHKTTLNEVKREKDSLSLSPFPSNSICPHLPLSFLSQYQGHCLFNGPDEDVLPDVGEEDGETTAGGLLVQLQVLSLEYKVFSRLWLHLWEEFDFGIKSWSVRRVWRSSIGVWRSPIRMSRSLFGVWRNLIGCGVALWILL